MVSSSVSNFHYSDTQFKHAQNNLIEKKRHFFSDDFDNNTRNPTIPDIIETIDEEILPELTEI